MRYLIALVAFLFSGGAFWLAYYLHRESAVKERWPTVSGTILERGVGERVGRASFAPMIKYRYSVGGKDYVCDQLYATGREGSGASSVQRLLDGLPNPVPVHYDPENPARAYLLPTSAWPMWVAGAFGIGSLVFAVMQLIG